MPKAIRSLPLRIAEICSLTKGASAFLERYEQATDSSSLTRLVIDREGMGASSTFTIQLPEATAVLSVGSNPVPTGCVAASEAS